MYKPNDGRSCGSKTPSPVKVGSKGRSRQSPWTAQRAKKKGKSCSPDTRAFNFQNCKEFLPSDGWSCDSENAQQLARHLELNPFREHLHSRPEFTVHNSATWGWSQSMTAVLQPSQDAINCEVLGTQPPNQPTPWATNESTILSSSFQTHSELPAPYSSGSSSASSSSSLVMTGFLGLTNVVAPEMTCSMQVRTSVPSSSVRDSRRDGPGLGVRSSSARRNVRPRSNLRVVTKGQAAFSRYAVPDDGGTPSPKLGAPGLRNDLGGLRPPRVPASSKTKRLVLAETPLASAHSGLGSGTFRERIRTALCFDDSDGEDAPMALENILQICGGEPGAFNDSLLKEEHSAMDYEAALSFEAQGKRGAWNQLVQRSDGNAIQAESGKAGISVGQAWESVRKGEMQPDSIDTLNSLLKSYCKVRCEPDEAEEVVRTACKDGRIQPNSSTYHHMASLWTRHEQLNN